MKTTWTEINPREVLIGFDRIYEQLSGDVKPPTYPPYNIVSDSENDWTIEIAAAGFDSSNLFVSQKENQLSIEGSFVHSDSDDTLTSPKGGRFIHKGIASRDFSLSFKLAEFVEVKSVKYKNGILSVSLQRNVPEERKPKVFQISSE